MYTAIMVKKKYIIKIKHQDSRKMSQKLLQTCFTPKILNLNIFILVYTQSMKLFMSHFFNSNSRTEILLILADQSRYDSANIGRWRFHTVGKVSGTSSTNNIYNVTTYLWRFFLEQCLLKLTFMLTAVLSCNIWSANGEENIPIYTQQISRKEPFVIVS